MHIRKKSKGTKNYVRRSRSRIVILFVTLFFTNVFSQQIKSDTLVQKKESISQFSRSKIFVTEGTLIYDFTEEEKDLVKNVTKSNSVTYTKEKSESIAKTLRKKKKEKSNKNSVEKKSVSSSNQLKIYKSSTDHSKFSFGNIVKGIGIFDNTFSKSAKVAHLFAEYPFTNYFGVVLKKYSCYTASFFSFQNCKNFFTRPPPYIF